MSIPEITVDELAERLAEGATVVDVRNPDEYVAAHIPGAILAPLTEVPDSLHHFATDGVTYVICKAGGRSMSACNFLAEQGFEVVNVAGGTDAWIRSGRDVAVGQDPA